MWISILNYNLGQIEVHDISEYQEENYPVLNDVFDENRANLQNIGKNIFVSGISHKTALLVNEKGSKAAAVTAIRMVKSMAPVQVVEEEIDFIVDRPFVFAIRDKVSGMILFIGEVNNL